MKQPRVFALACGLAVLGLLAIIGGGLAVFYFLSKGFDERQPTEAEKKLLIAPSALASFGAGKLDGGAVRYSAKRNFDRSIELQCEHDKEGFYFISGAEIHRSKRDARESFRLQILAYKGGVSIGSGQLQNANTLIGSGDERYAGYIRKNGNIVGNVFAIRQGRVVHTLLLTGIYFSEREDVEALFAPLLEEARRH